MPPPLPTRPPFTPLTFEQQVKRDAETLDLLAMFHFIYGGLGVLGTLVMAACMFLMGGLMAAIMQQMVTEPDQPKALAGLPYMMTGYFLVIALALAAYSMTTVACGFYLKQRRHRTFTIVMAALHCASFPFGTVLGVCTMVVLQRDAARSLYVD